MLLQPGQVLAERFRVERVLGEGGMGIVVAAYHLELDDHVAIKLIRPEVAANQEIGARFLREARTARKIKGEHAGKVLEVGALPETGAPYMVMELLVGQDLSKLLAAEGRLTPELVATSVMQACEALAEAHAQGIIHRDLKPANLFLTQRHDGSPCVKVLDFGIAKVGGLDAHSVTRTQAMMGTPIYTSPEQLASAKNVDARADVWALGVTMFELLTADLPFPGQDLPSIIAGILTVPARSVHELAPYLDPRWDHVIGRCLAKDCAQRYPSVVELVSDLAAFAPAAQAYVARVAGALGPMRSAAAHSGSIPFPSATPLPSGGWSATAQSPHTPFPTPATPQLTPAPQQLWVPPPAAENSGVQPAPSRAPLLIALAVAVPLLLSGAALLLHRQFTVPMVGDDAAGPPPRRHLPAAEAPPASTETTAKPQATASTEATTKPQATGTTSGAPSTTASAGEVASAVPTATPSSTSGRFRPSPPVPATTSTGNPKPPTTAPPTVAPATKPNCDPSYYFDATGNRHFKPECF